MCIRDSYEGGIRCTSLTGEGTDDLPVEAPVSMNLWGFGKSFLGEADRRFAGWLRENLPKLSLIHIYDLDLDLGQQGAVHRHAAVFLGGALLDAAAHHLGHGHAGHTQIVQRGLELIELGEPCR